MTWRTMSPSRVPIYNERKHRGYCREIYIPNPGLAHCARGGLSEQELRRTEEAKFKIGDELISASIYQDERGATFYWTLWAPKKQAHLLKDKMRELGVSPAQVSPN